MHQAHANDQQHQSREFLDLFEVYTANAKSIGSNLTSLTASAAPDAPLIVATGADLVLFPGAGRPAEVEGYRLTTRGFKELAAISHLGPALASIVRIKQLEGEGGLWRAECQRLLAATQAARRVNSPGLWRNFIAVPAFAGRETAIANMIDYACAVTERYIERALAQPETFTAHDLRIEYLEAQDSQIGATVPINKVMIATFFLVGMDTAHRVMSWFARHEIDWSKAMVLVVGRQGRPTAGVTLTTNALVSFICGASDFKLDVGRIYIAPHAPPFHVSRPINADELASQERDMRKLWWYTRAMSDLAPMMYEGYPRFANDAAARPQLRPETTQVSELPSISGPDDWRALNTRMRVILEDPRQLLAGCVVDYAVDLLARCGNDPAKVVVPGLDATSYPAHYAQDDKTETAT